MRGGAQCQYRPRLACSARTSAVPPPSSIGDARQCVATTSSRLPAGVRSTTPSACARAAPCLCGRTRGQRWKGGWLHLWWLHLWWLHLRWLHLRWLHLRWLHLWWLHLGWLPLGWLHLGPLCLRPLHGPTFSKGLMRCPPVRVYKSIRSGCGLGCRGWGVPGGNVGELGRRLVSSKQVPLESRLRCWLHPRSGSERYATGRQRSAGTNLHRKAADAAACQNHNVEKATALWY